MLEIIRRLKTHYPGVTCSLRYETPFQLLIATVLSAQCTDERVNQVTKDLFARYSSPEEFASISQEELENRIRSTGFFRQKAQNIRKLAEILVTQYQGKVPNSLEKLTALPGVGRKTANVVLGTAFQKNEGVVVDTHVKRISKRLGLTQQSDPEKIELDLMQIIPRKEWTDFSHLLIHHGRRLCQARKPLCRECFLKDLCPAFTGQIQP